MRMNYKTVCERACELFNGRSEPDVKIRVGYGNPTIPSEWVLEIIAEQEPKGIILRYACMENGTCISSSEVEFDQFLTFTEEYVREIALIDLPRLVKEIKKKIVRGEFDI
jgi:hypothetical protein